jgi:hypothetical protein
MVKFKFLSKLKFSWFEKESLEYCLGKRNSDANFSMNCSNTCFSVPEAWVNSSCDEKIKKLGPLNNGSIPNAIKNSARGRIN